MQINNKVGINPEYWGAQKLSDFLSHFKGKASPELLKEVHKKCKQLVKVEPKEESKEEKPD